MTNYATKSHHFSLTSPAADTASGLAKGDVIGFTCITDPAKNAPFYKELDGQYLVDLFNSGQVDEIAKNPQEDLPIIQSDWRSGFGLSVQDYDDPKRYFSAHGSDMRFKDRAMLSWGATAVTKPVDPSDPTIVNADMELNSDWTASSGTWAQSSTQNHTPSGTYSWKNTNGAGGVVYQDIAGFVPGTEYTVTVWFYNANAGDNAKIGIDDGVTATYGSTGGTSSTWVQLTHTKTLAVNADKMRINLSVGTQIGSDHFYDDVACTANTSLTVGAIAPRCSCDFNGINYAAFGRVLAKKNAGATAFTVVAYMPQAVTCLQPYQVAGTDYLFIALGSANTCYYMSTAELLTLSTTAVKTFQYFSWVNTTVDTMYGNDGVNTIRSTINPLNGGTAWSAQTVVGEASNSITGLMSKSGALYIAKEDMPYYLSSAGAVQKDLAPELVALTSTTSGKNSDIYLGNWYYPAGNQALLEIGTANTWRTPAEFCTNNHRYNGRVFAVTHDDQWLIALVGSGYANLLTNTSFETGDPPTGWTAGDATLSRETSPTPKVGSYILKIIATANFGQAKQNISSYAQYAGKTVTMGAWLYAPSTNTGNSGLDIYDGVSEDFTYVAKDDAWHWVTVTRTVDASVSELRPRAMCWTSGDVLYVDGAILAECSSLEEPTSPYYFSNALTMMCGRLEVVDGTTRWVWHPYQEIPIPNCSTAWVTSIDQKSLFVAPTSAYDLFYRIPLPTGYGDLPSDANRAFLTGGFFETSFLHGKFKADTKAWIKVVGTLEHTYDADIYWTIQYKTLEDTAYTNIGNLVGTATDRTHTLYIPADSSSNDPVSTMMRFKGIGVTDDTAKTPVLLNLDVRSILYPQAKDIIWAKVKVAKQMLTKGGTSRDMWAKRKACLDKCRDVKYPVILKDIDGTTTQVRLLQLPQSLPWRELVSDEKGKDYDYVYNVLMLRTPTS